MCDEVYETVDNIVFIIVRECFEIIKKYLKLFVIERFKQIT
jgi:hypothetical protein